MSRLVFRFHPVVWSVLSLGACVASRPAYNPQQVELRLEAQATEAYNIVWLRATLRNSSPYALWLPESRDSIYHAFSRSPVFLQGLTPKGDTLAQCDPFSYKLGYPRYTRLEAGAERTFFFRVDFNQVFPQAFLDSLAAHDASGRPDCSRYLNRTPGVYRFTLVAGGRVGRKPRHRQWTELRRKQYRLHVVSNHVTVLRKQ